MDRSAVEEVDAHDKGDGARHSPSGCPKTVLSQLGMSESETKDVAEMFLERDEQLLAEQHAIHDSEEKLIQTAKETVIELETLFKSDRKQ